MRAGIRMSARDQVKF
jgi:hypothetical protein